MDDQEPPLPEGWTKHWSKTWNKHYWFDSKTGKQAWEPPAAPQAIAATPADATSAFSGGGGAGTKRPALDTNEDANKAARTQPPPSPAKVETAPSKPKVPAATSAGGGGAAMKAAPPPVKKASGGLLGSLLGSIEKDGATMDTHKIAEVRRKRKEAEDSRKAEERASRDNYRKFVVATLEAFSMNDEDVHEFPPTDNLHRLIVQDEAESRGMPSISQGVDGVDRRAYVFKPDKGPGERELRFLQMEGTKGTVEELLRRRAMGDDFMEYNIHFSLNDAKLVNKTRAAKYSGANDEDEEDIDSRVVQDRSGDAGAKQDIMDRLKLERGGA